jgi:hypothetical protein
VNRCGERLKILRRAVAASAKGDTDISSNDSGLFRHAIAALSNDRKARVAAQSKTSLAGVLDIHFAYYKIDIKFNEHIMETICNDM